MSTHINLRKILRGSLRMYFAPLAGAYKAVRAEMHRVERENARRLGRSAENGKHA